MTYKRVTDLTEGDVRQIVALLMERTQDLELRMAELAALVLYGLGEVAEPPERVHQHIVRHIMDFLNQTATDLEQIERATAQIVEQQARQN